VSSSAFQKIVGSVTHVLDTSKMRTPSNSAPRQSHSATSDTWADTTTTHGRLMPTVLGGLAEFERSFCDPCR
jgi:hypothetical protein